MNPIYKPKGAAAHIKDSLRAEMEKRRRKDGNKTVIYIEYRRENGV